ncbi:hypothetical protein K437DRAFT_227137 [Tilletiaria anomala UBC 951]|uniref:Uncharacterized protein n=1 Tax=Tilletiaria anomala (strain ATCC 24038 / CBS 436.72 / UBC 951) TaxID=1037660 RepID=A0A066VPT6_TILAU|nr:uncharacterized protein K437DRAFT_227137 [Tilletiaria anomala UBC 951]KDN40779.1 hypothetical protein K437DRAFT_227137 [Tilletiaria anomala UBC 951]
MSSVLDPTPSRVAPRGRDPSTSVWYKLGVFSAALFAAPLAAYYGAKDRYFGGNSTYAGGLAAIIANVILIAYVVMAFLEDDGSGSNDAKKTAGDKKTEVGHEKETKKDR